MNTQQNPSQPMPRPLNLPGSWLRHTLPTLATVDDVTLALEKLQGRTWTAPTAEKDYEATVFAETFWSQLAGPSAHVRVNHPLSMTSLQAATLTAAWMGVPTDAVHRLIGGTVSKVVSGVGHRHDQSWHTDSTPWKSPNNYSVLGHLNGAEEGSGSTDLITVDSLKEYLTQHPESLSALKHEKIPWRSNFPKLAEMHEPIFGQVSTRWVWPVIEPILDSFSPSLRNGILIIMNQLNVSEHFSPVVKPGTVLIFDNRRVLHRGPAIGNESRRELVRIKVGGNPVR